MIVLVSKTCRGCVSGVECRAFVFAPSTAGEWQEVRMRESGPNSRRSRGRISRVKQMSGKKTARRRSGSSRTGLLEGEDDRRNRTLGCFRGTNSEETKVFLRSPVSQDGEGVTWNWGLCRERFDGTHTMLLRAPGADGPRSCQVRGRCEQLSCGCEEEKQTRRTSRRVVANCKLCRTSFRLPTEGQLRFVTS
jgi:hypothetical protein